MSDKTGKSEEPKKSHPEDYVNQSLDGFSMQEWTEVYKTDTGEKKVGTVGLLKNEDVAEAFAEQQADPQFCGTRKVFVLTNGEVAFEIHGSIEVLDEKQTRAEIRKNAISKLSEAQRRVIGFSE